MVCPCWLAMQWPEQIIFSTVRARASLQEQLYVVGTTGMGETHASVPISSSPPLCRSASCSSKLCISGSCSINGVTPGTVAADIDRPSTARFNNERARNIFGKNDIKKIATASSSVAANRCHRHCHKHHHNTTSNPSKGLVAELVPRYLKAEEEKRR